MNEFSPPGTGGKGAAAIMAAAVAALALGIFTMAGDAVPAAAAFFNVWKPTGPLSGVTDLTVAAWLAAWFILSKRWKERDVKFRRVNSIAALMIIAGLLLTFPPFMDFLQGK